MKSNTTQANRRTWLTALAAASGLSLLPEIAMAADDYPNHPIRMVVPFGPGTTTDIIGRLFGEAMGKVLGQVIVVENRAGAGGNIGSESVAKSTPDGYTILTGTVGTHAINPALYKRIAFDPVKDFAPIGFAGSTPTFLVVAAGSPFKTLKDLVDKAHRPGGLTFASAGNGTSGHLAGELMHERLGGTMVHVPYKEGGQALADVMGGQTDFMFYHPAAVMPQIKGGKLRALAVSSSTRSKAAPDVATMTELGAGDFDLVPWFMLYAPAAVPAPVLAKLRSTMARVVSDPETAEKLAVQGVDVRLMSPEQLNTFATAELAKWSGLVKQSGASID